MLMLMLLLMLIPNIPRAGQLGKGENDKFPRPEEGFWPLALLQATTSLYYETSRTWITSRRYTSRRQRKAAEFFYKVRGQLQQEERERRTSGKEQHRKEKRHKDAQTSSFWQTQ